MLDLKLTNHIWNKFDQLHCNVTIFDIISVSFVGNISLQNFSKCSILSTFLENFLNREYPLDPLAWLCPPPHLRMKLTPQNIYKKKSL